LDQKLEEVKEKSILGRGFLCRPVKYTKLSLRMGDIAIFKQKVYAYNGALQGAFQMINE
jgi:hypothetical protein